MIRTIKVWLPVLGIFMCLFTLAQATQATQADQAADGVQAVQSRYSVQQTVDKMEQVLKNRKMTLFAKIEHAKAAHKVGIELRDTVLLIFGNPKLGSPLMQCQQSVAIDLPHKVLIWEDANGKVWISYNQPQYLQKRHQISNCEATLAKMEKGLAAMVQSAAD